MNYRFFTRALCVLATVTAIAALASCSLKKNTAATRQYTAFITRYNIYYNGDTHYKETLDEMEKKYEDDYSRLVFTHPAEARADANAPQPTGDFTRSIEKAQKAIQVRSIKKKPAKKAGRASDPEYKAWMKRDEYNPFLHNAWMMMGRSQFLNGDFLGAASTFFYITKHFTWLPATVTEAKIWQARSYCAIDWLFEAEMILTRIKPDELVNGNLKYLYNLTYTDFYINSNKPTEAIPYLVDAVKDAHGAQKIRLNFLLGQLYTLAGDKKSAYKAFDKAGSASSATYRTKFNARIKQSEVFEGENITSEVNALRRMTRYDRNKEYLDQIYYAIGNLYLSRRDTTNAISNYEMAVEKSTRNGIDKAITLLTLGGLYYDLGDYVKAQPCYSEALPQVPETYPDYKMLKRRSDNLDELAVYAQNVTLQDSLLKLSYMTPEEQTAVAERLIAELKKKEAEEAEQARRDEARANAAAKEDPFGGNASSPTTFTMNSDNSWYFYNPSTVTAGKTDFQRRWGSRKLEDDWRRRNKAAYAFDTTADDAEDEEAESAENPDADTAEEQPDKETQERQNDPHFVEYYLKQIPKNDQERLVANDVIQEGLYNMGIILKDKLEDFAAARTEFDRLLTRYPDNVYRLDTYYNLYLMAVREGNMTLAEHWRNLIVNDFADSPYGRAMRDPDYIDNLRKMDARQDVLYDAAYEAYLDNDNTAVHRAYDEMSRDFPMSKLMPKFMFINALAYVTENKPEEFKQTLTEMLQRYPDTDLTPYAASYVKGLEAGRKLHSVGSNMRGMLWETRLSNDSTAVDPDNPLEFDLNPNEEQLFILLYPTDKVAPNQLLYDIARHNFTSFVVKDFDLEQMNFGRLGLLIIKPFANVSEINHYRSVLQSDASLQLSAEVRPVVISAKNFDTLLHGGGSFEDYFRYVEDKTYRDTEERVLPPEFFGPSEGIVEEDEQSNQEEEAQSNQSDKSNQESQSNQSNQEVEGNQEEVKAPTAPSSPITPTVPITPIAPKAPTPAATKAPAPKAPAPLSPPAPKPSLPDYPAGSEGDDDPLLD